MKSPFIKSNWAGGQKIMFACFRATLPVATAVVLISVVSFASVQFHLRRGMDSNHIRCEKVEGRL